MGCVVFVLRGLKNENVCQDTLCSISFRHPWINGDHFAWTVLKTILAHAETGDDLYSSSEGRTMVLIWEKTNIKREVQVVYVAVSTLRVRL